MLKCCLCNYSRRCLKSSKPGSPIFKKKSAVINNLKNDRTIGTGVVNKAQCTRIKGLAEAILLQLMEDLWIDEERSGCMDFFMGEGFSICSEIAGMSSDDKIKILNIVYDIISNFSKRQKN